jgi:peptide/nickel transport system substrate-binding protein
MFNRTPKRGRLLRALVAGVVIISFGLVGCTGTEGQTAQTGDSKPGRIPLLKFGDFGGGTNPKENYNPFLEANRLAAWGYVYESLMELDEISCKEVPWLATDYSWDDDKTLTFTLRDGVKFSDGEAFTSDDVVFTFTMLKEHSALDTRGMWNYLAGVTAPDERTVTFTFKEPGSSAFTNLIAIPIVPEHIWAEQKDPTKFVAAPDPVGTGPMLVDKFNPQRLTIKRNPEYWQADKIKVDQIQFSKADGGGQVEQLKLARGDYDQNAMFVPDIEKVYVAKDPKHNHYWYPPGSPISVFMNLEKKPFDDVEFRKAVAHAIDRKKIIDQAQFGYVTAASQTGLVLPGMADFLPEELKGQASYISFDAAEADRILTEAGYRKDSKGNRLGKDGKPIEFSFKVEGGWTDWVSAAQIIAKNLGELGITVNVQTPAPESVIADRTRGEYEMAFGVRGGSCNMYANFYDPLSSEQTAPSGKNAATNEVRWRDEQTDQLLAQLRTAISAEEQQAPVGELSKIMMEEVPYVPVWYGAHWFQYSTKNAVGWPNEKDPYSKPTHGLLILTHLRPPNGEK